MSLRLMHTIWISGQYVITVNLYHSKLSYDLEFFVDRVYDFMHEFSLVLVTDYVHQLLSS